MSGRGMRWYKNKDSDHVWWLESEGDGEFLFSFDRSKIFNLFRDYPHALTKAQLARFDEENPRWADFFSDRRR